MTDMTEERVLLAAAFGALDYHETVTDARGNHATTVWFLAGEPIPDDVIKRLVKEGKLRHSTGGQPFMLVPPGHPRAGKAWVASEFRPTKVAWS